MTRPRPARNTEGPTLEHSSPAQTQSVHEPAASDLRPAPTSLPRSLSPAVPKPRHPTMTPAFGTTAIH
eukprot:16444257-Heterocapsa_arctica.AAC.1